MRERRKERKRNVEDRIRHQETERNRDINESSIRGNNIGAHKMQNNLVPVSYPLTQQKKVQYWERERERERERKRERERERNKERTREREREREKKKRDKE